MSLIKKRKDQKYLITIEHNNTRNIVPAGLKVTLKAKGNSMEDVEEGGGESDRDG